MADKITITIGRFGEETVKVTVPKGTTVRKALKEADIDPSEAENVWKGGERATLSQKLAGNVILNVVGEKDGGR